MRPRDQALAYSSAVAVAAAVLAVAAPQAVWVRVPLGLPLVLVLPGYGVARALFPGATLGRLERVTLSLGLSIATAVLAGLAVAASPAGLSRDGWAIALGGVTLLANAAAYGRDRLRDAIPDARPAVPARAYTAAGALAAATLVLALALASADASRPASGQLVELWALPGSARDTRDVRVGVRNTLSPWQSFHLVVTHADSVVTDTWLDVPKGATRTMTVRMPRGASHLTPLRASLTAPAPRPLERIVMIWPSQASTRTAGAAGAR